MSAEAPTREEALADAIDALSMTSGLLAQALSDVDDVLQREAAGALAPAEALGTLRAILDRSYGEAGTAH